MVPQIDAHHVQGLWQAMDKEGEMFDLLWHKFSKMCEVKMREGILVSVKLKQLLEDHDYSRKLNATERRAWEAIEKAVETF